VKLQFKVQDYQTAAVDAVVDCFAGQPFIGPERYLVDPGKRQTLDVSMFEEAGLRNAAIALSNDQLLSNIRAVQQSQQLTPSTSLVFSAAGASVPNLDVEMETGTGKTYVYIKTIMEMHRRYGWSKFIIVVPSIAIREGVRQAFDLTAEHFQAEYGTKPRAFIYDSKRLHEVERFSSDSGVQVMIINIQAFNATGKDNRRIYEELDDFQSRRPIDVISANRPIVIIDEPQKIGAPKSLEALSRFNPLMILRYSATHKVEHNKVHRLDAVDAYNAKLVKKISVRGIKVQGLAGSVAYMYLDSINVVKGAKPSAMLEIEVQTKGGPIVRQRKKVEQGTNLHDLANGVEAYKPQGQALLITDIDAVRGVVELNNGDVLEVGQATEDVTEDSKRRIQIREAIKAHLDKEQTLYGQGIKVLSLFFIDEVAKYRDYDHEDTLGDYARMFEEEYENAVRETLEKLDLGDAELAPDKAYRAYLERDKVRAVHEGYFSIDKKTRRQVDPEVAKAKKGEEAGQATDVDAYDLILKNKERLLSFDEPVRFIFSHSALREGWDNPNVFVMGMLKRSDNVVSRRQEIGRGLRLAVNQHGERMDNPATVHDINQLTVVTDESYTAFVEGLQKEIAESVAGRPRKASKGFFVGRIITDNDGTQRVIDDKLASAIHRYLEKCDYLDLDEHLTELAKEHAEAGTLDAPTGAIAELVAPIIGGLPELLKQLIHDIPIPEDGRKSRKIGFNKKNFDRKEFQELWRRINHKAVYQVEFDSQELISKCVRSLDKHLKVASLSYTVEVGEQRDDLEADDLRSGEGFTKTESRQDSEKVMINSQVQYDVIGEITEKTQLTRRTVATILTKITPETFTKFRLNPEQFITEAARIINEEKATVVVEHLTYDSLTETFDSDIFTENQTKQDLSKAVGPLKKSVYDYVMPDSQAEGAFALDLDISSAVAVYTKLPRGFFIPTPVGNYNPDWAIAFVAGTVKHVYFVAETKGSMSSMQLRKIEETKIDCARKFFAELTKRDNANVTYDVVTDYAALMSLVTTA
jgi:type III restriction enzyme